MPDQRSRLYPIRIFNKHVLNQLTRHLAWAARGPFALVHHVGRRSGKPYETPVLAEPVSGGFVLALTYGPDVDWYRNVMAAGQCRIVWHGKEYGIDRVESIDKRIALSAFPQPFKLILRIFGTQHFLRMNYSEVPVD